ncbi:MAG: enoyl-CoA hydratase [Betaproteobacteria bacterium HGW-Betaproteobacteria-11]|nr:MAG: enoyl-CoA hydratase [Betaproteobacteria bacterium HGW-Betaproteobacteria-11]
MHANQEGNAELLRHDADGIVTLTLNRPAQFNALSEGLLMALQRELDAIAGDGAMRVVVIAGAGKAFCAGHDLKEMRRNHEQVYLRRLFGRISQLMLSIGRLPQPVIARVHGIATAAGCQLVAACDLAVASDAARFAVSGINVGLFCSTPAVALSRVMARKPALEMLLTGEFIDAAEAQRRGLVNRVTPPDQLDVELEKLAAVICAKSPLAVKLGKQMFYRQLEMGLEGAYQLAAETMTCNMLSEDAAHGIDCFIEKKPPQWQGR